MDSLTVILILLKVGLYDPLGPFEHYNSVFLFYDYYKYNGSKKKLLVKFLRCKKTLFCLLSSFD